MDKKHLLAFLADAQISDFRCFDSIGSTNDEALAWIDQDAPDFALVISDEQTKGRGRFDRRWVTNPGSSLAFSVILKPKEIGVINLSLYAPLCGLAVRDALANFLSIDAQIKWPNDVLIRRKKVCGILVESVWGGDTLKGIVAGIGINVSRGSLPPPEFQLFSATCLEDEFNKSIDRFALLREVLISLSSWREKIGSDVFFNEWQKHLAFKDEMVRIVQSENHSIIGKEKGIDPDGRLVLTLNNGEEMAFEVGDVHLRPAI